MKSKSKSQTDFRFADAPVMNTSASELFERYQTLTGQEKKILKLILRNYRQKAICKMLNIQLGTEKTYRKKVHEKMEIKDFSDLTDSDRDLLLKFTHEK
jgi:FixJ family two-component response regulator